MRLLPSRATLTAAGLLFAAGLPGVFATLLVAPDLPGVPKAALLINPLVLLAVFALIGAAIAPRIGLRSLMVERALGSGSFPSASHWRLPVLLGLAAGLAIAMLDALTTPLWRGAATAPQNIIEAWTPSALVVGLLYGGVTEEVLMRWGLMSLLVWVFSGVPRRQKAPAAWAVWLGIGGAAFLFGFGHLPAVLLTGAELTTGVVGRTVLLNAAAGLLFGWLFLRRDLECAMAAHAAAHLGFGAVGLTALT